MRVPIISSIIDWFYQIDLFYTKKEEENKESFIPVKYLQIWWKWFEQNPIMGQIVEKTDYSYEEFNFIKRKLDNLKINQAHKILDYIGYINDPELSATHPFKESNSRINNAQKLLYEEIKIYEGKNKRKSSELSSAYSRLEEIKNSLKWCDAYLKSNLDALKSYSNYYEKRWETRNLEYDKNKSRRAEKLWKKGIKESFNVDKKAYYEIANKILNTIKAIEVKYDEIAELLEQYRVEQFKPIQMWSFLFP